MFQGEKRQRIRKKNSAQGINYSKSRILTKRIPVTVEVKPVIVGVEPGN